jgi:ABC-type multidrug transport system ATPase subunit
MIPTESTTTTVDHTSDAVYAIKTEDLTKRYGDLTAVDAVNLLVKQGEIYGFLGRNGAGKTTTIRMLLGLIRPTQGRAMIFGNEVSARRIAAVAPIGSLVETATAYPSLTVMENLEIQRRLTGVSSRSVHRAIDLLGLEALTDRRAGHLSLGNKQRLAIARAILSHPRLLVLDEPANGLDPAGIVEIRHLLHRLAAEDGVTVFVSSHILGEIAQLADRIGIIHNGRMIEEVNLHSDVGDSPNRFELEVSEPQRALVLVEAIPGIDRVQLRGDGTLEVIPGNVRASAIARLLVESGVDIESLVPVREDLETHFLRLTGGHD